MGRPKTHTRRPFTQTRSLAGLVKSIQGWWDEQRANGVICEPLCEVTILDGPNSYDPELMVCWARVAFPTLAHADLALGMDGICLLPYLNEVPPMSKGRILVQRYPNPDMMSYPNRMATMFQARRCPREEGREGRFVVN